MPIGELSSRCALVTGGSSGIGLAIAKALAADGAAVIIAARGEERAAAAADAISKRGGRVEALACDVSSETEVEALFVAVKERFGRLDLLVNNAGTLALDPIEALPVDDWDRVIATNLRGTFLCTRQAFAIMRAQGGGRILNIGSLSALRVRANNAAYNASKFAIEGLTQSTALEGRPFGIACGSLHPGNTLSDLTNDPAFPEPLMEPDQVARMVLTVARMPIDMQVAQMIVHPVGQMFVGRG